MAKKKFKGTIFTGTTGDDVADADGVFNHNPPGITGFTPNNLAKLQDNRGDIIRGLAGNDQVSAGPRGDTIKGGAGFDDLRGNGGRDNLDGGDDADSCDGGNGNDVVKGGAGDDLLFGSAGNDKVYGGAGNDSGPAAVVGLFGGTGNDLVDGGTGNDSLYGQEGNDLLKGGVGADSLSGGEDADRLIGGHGQDTMLGDAGQDRFVFKDKHDSGKTLLTADHIQDFQSIADQADPLERDHIDLRGIERQIGHDLKFKGAGTDPGKFKIVFDAATEQVLIDTNGKAGVDMVIDLSQGTVTALTKGDFIL
jgi:Ca2+-binding RTX toxin-like protein